MKRIFFLFFLASLAGFADETPKAVTPAAAGKTETAAKAPEAGASTARGAKMKLQTGSGHTKSVALPSMMGGVVKLPDVKPDDPIVTVGTESLTWNALKEMASLQISKAKLPSMEISPEEYQNFLNRLIMQRAYSLATRFTSKALMAQEAVRAGIKLDPADTAAKEAEVYDKLEKSGKASWIKTYKKPGSFFSHEFTNSLLMIAYREKIVTPSIHVTDADIQQTVNDRIATNKFFEAANRADKASLEKHRELILAGKEDFGKIAEEISNCDSSLDEGVWGTKTEEDLLPVLWQAAVSLPTNTLSQVIETEFSFDLMKVTKRHYAPGAKEDDPKVKPISLDISHIERDKKMPLPLLTPETARALVQKKRENAAMLALEKKLRETAKVVTPLDLRLKAGPKKIFPSR